MWLWETVFSFSIPQIPNIVWFIFDFQQGGGSRPMQEHSAPAPPSVMALSKASDIFSES